MTLSMAWVRRVNQYEELVLATDSRLRAGYAWDTGPKIMTLPRLDSAICFAGKTEYAYPLMLQMKNAVTMYPKSRSRAMDIDKMKGHALRVFNHMLSQMSDFPFGTDTHDDPTAVFILGGYSWIRKRFKIWLLHYDNSIKKFTFRAASPWKGVHGRRLIVLAGYPAEEVVPEAKERLINLLKKRNTIANGNFDMEPFEVLRDIIRDKVFPYVGGPPQIVKVYQHMNCTPFGVFWPNLDSKERAILGRPLMPYESTHYPILDPDTLKTHFLFKLNENEAIMPALDDEPEIAY